MTKYEYEVWFYLDCGEEHFYDTYSTREEAEDAVLGIKDEYGNVPCIINVVNTEKRG